jgi:uncharacterized protein YbjT (DUF2867 family)
MYAITGITGQVGGALAEVLLAAHVPVRAIVRDSAKGASWLKRGCDVVLADVTDTAALTVAFSGVEGVFVMLPPTFDPSPGFPEARAAISALRIALAQARPARVVCLSTIGAQATRPNLLNQLGLMEQELGTLPMPIAFVRAGWFMENSLWDVASARDEGVFQSYLQPLDKPVPMIATADIGRVAATLLQERWTGRRIVELEGPRRVSPNEVAATFSKIFGRPVHAVAVPHEKWLELFSAQGMKNPTPRIQMLDGFNEGWIAFEAGANATARGEVEIETVLRELVKRVA